METDGALLGQAALRAHFSGLRRDGLATLAFTVADSVYGGSGDLAWIYAACHVEARYAGLAEARAAPFRLTLVARRLGGDWALVCAHQSCQQQTGLPAQGEPAHPGGGDAEARAIGKAIAEGFSGGWAALDLDRVASVWDRGSDRLVYMAFEGPQALRSWAEVLQYSERLRANGLQSGTRFRWRELPVAEICGGRAGDLLWVHCPRDYAVYHPDAPDRRLGGHPYRETWLARYAGGVWRAFHYHESVRAAVPLEAPFVAQWWPD
jgi:hypothetical protein